MKNERPAELFVRYQTVLSEMEDILENEVFEDIMNSLREFEIPLRFALPFLIKKLQRIADECEANKRD